MPLTHSLRKRFIFKLAGNLAAVGLGVVALAVASRALGPADFGRFEFLTANFKLVLDTLTLQLPVAYFNWVSRKGHKENIDYATGVTFYWSVAVMILFAIFVYVTTALEVNQLFWPDVETHYLWLALGFTSAIFLYQLSIFLADGRALTVGLEKIRLAQNVLKTLGILALFGVGLLTLTSYFFIQIAVAVFSVTVTLVWLNSRSVFSTGIFQCWKLDKGDQVRFHEFSASYIKPLMISMLVGFAYIYFDRWFLQFIAGSSQQGYYALSERLGMVIFIFTSAMTPLITREYAFAYEEKDTARLVKLFERIKIVIFISTAAGCFMSVNSEAIVILFSGKAYQEAIIPVAIMMLYPIHQTLGQLSGALMLATGRTKLYANLAIAVMLFSAPFTYLLLAPVDYVIPGLALGATGLAIKMVLVQFIGVNVQLYFNTKYLGIAFKKWLMFQINIIVVIYVAALTSYLLAGQISSSTLAAFQNFGIAQHMLNLASGGLIFTGLIAAIILLIPSIVGISKEDILAVLGKRAFPIR